jgi:tRNA(Ile)-lysidine synthetase-like protein
VRLAGRGLARTPPAPPAPLLMERPGSYRWGAGTLEVLADVRRRPSPPGDGRAEFDAELLDWPLTARIRKSGDRMRPRGGRGSRKLSDLMIDARIVRATRAALPIVTSASGELLFVPGLRPAETARPTARTRRVVTIDFLTEDI